MTEQEAHVKAEIAWMRANLTQQAFADWCRAHQGQHNSWLDDFERDVMRDSSERLSEV